MHQTADYSLQIAIANEQQTLAVDAPRWKQMIAAIVGDTELTSAEISVAVVDDATIHRLNREFLEHDYPTDVLSFVLDCDGEHLEGEIIVSADTAESQAPKFDWPAEDELLLYVIHGTLHLVGYDDKQTESRARMRQAEAHYLKLLGVRPRGGDALETTEGEKSP